MQKERRSDPSLVLVTVGYWSIRKDVKAELVWRKYWSCAGEKCWITSRLKILFKEQKSVGEHCQPVAWKPGCRNLFDAISAACGINSIQTIQTVPSTTALNPKRNFWAVKCSYHLLLGHLFETEESWWDEPVPCYDLSYFLFLLYTCTHSGTGRS